jgi:hypothetical protein
LFSAAVQVKSLKIAGMNPNFVLADYYVSANKNGKEGDVPMLRKTILAIAAAAALGTAALAPTSASAWGGHGGWHGGGWHGGGWHRGWGPGFYGPGYGGCMVRRWVYTPYGPVLRWVNRCY